MFRCGLLILTSPIHQLLGCISPILNEATSIINDSLIIHLQPELDVLNSAMTTLSPPTESLSKLIANIYANAGNNHKCCDVRVLLHNFSTSSGYYVSPHKLSKPIEVVLTDFPDTGDSFKHFVRNCFNIQEDIIIEQLSTSATDDTTHEKAVDNVIETYDHIVLGGTFDRLHSGHKILLSESCLRAEKKITIGVTDGPMIAKKQLSELILPVRERIQSLNSFLLDVKPQVLHDLSLVPILDPFGPSIIYADMGGIVVSEETRAGGNAVNRKRKEKGLNELDVHVIQLVEDTHHASHEEGKISSSSHRMRLLGSLLKAPLTHPTLPSRPYIIGLTGGIASGKSSICKRLETLGAGIVNCDQLGHRAYEPGTNVFEKVVKLFGDDVVAEDGFIDRRALGVKVFSKRSNLEKLNEIVWPAIAQMAKSQIDEYARQGVEICVLDAAVLLEAGWETMVHEVWVSIIPKDETLKRIIERDNIAEGPARQRIDSQLSNQVRVDAANVVLSTLWEPHVTQKQVEKAWSGLLERIHVVDQTQPKL